MLGVAETTTIWPRGWSSHPHSADLGVVNHLHGSWGWPATPQLFFFRDIFGEICS
jgi:hypothetical protein